MSPRLISKQFFVTFASINASLGVFLGSYSVAIFNSIQEILQKYIFPDASVSEISFFASAPLLGAVIGSLFTDRLTKTFGRRQTMILTSLVSLFGIVLTMMPNIHLVVLGRILAAFEAGVSSILVNIYITEISKDPLRGLLGAIPSFIAGSGSMAAFLTGWLMPFFIKRGIPEIGFRLLLGLPALLNLFKIMNLIFIFKFETPFYLVTQKKESEAREVLELLFDDGHSAQLKEIIEERDYLNQNAEISFLDLFKAQYRKAFFMSNVMTIGYILMGGVVPGVFSNMIFSEGSETSYTNINLMFTNLVAVLGFVGGVLALVFFKYSGRRRLLMLIGTSILACIDLSVALIIHFDSLNNIIAKLLIACWLFVAGATIQPVSSLYSAETLPDKGVVLNNLFGIFFSFISVQAFIPLKIALGYEHIYSIFTGMAVISLGLYMFFLIETKDKSKLEAYKSYKNLSDDKNKLEGYKYAELKSEDETATEV